MAMESEFAVESCVQGTTSTKTSGRGTACRVSCTFCCSAIPTYPYILNVFYTCLPDFCSSILDSTPHTVHKVALYTCAQMKKMALHMKP